MGVVGIAWNDSFAPWILGALVIIDAAFVFCLGIWSSVHKRFSDGQNELRELNCDDIIASMQSEIDALKLKAEKERDCYNEKLSSRNDSERLIVAQLETVLRSKAEAMNDLVKIFLQWVSETNRIKHFERAFDDSDDEANQKEKEDFIAQSVANEVARAKKAFYAKHRWFLGQITEAVRRSVESHLRCQGFNLQVSIAVKLFYEPSTVDDLQSSGDERSIYTGFRDEISWQGLRRQGFPMPLYTLRGNSDFVYSIRNNRAYVFNNAERSTSYENESMSFPEHYNCGVTAAICSETTIEDKDERHCYGFLACDVKNDDADKNPMDDTIARIIECYSHLLGLYYDRLDDMWFNFDNHQIESLTYSCETEGTLDFEYNPGTSFFYNYYRYLEDDLPVLSQADLSN